MAHEDLESYFKTNFALVQHHKYTLSDIENMIPWERDIYVNMLSKWLADERERIEKERQSRKRR